MRKINVAVSYWTRYRGRMRLYGQTFQVNIPDDAMLREVKIEEDTSDIIANIHFPQIQNLYEDVKAVRETMDLRDPSMTCVRCGVYRRTDDAYCWHCGNRFRNNAELGLNETPFGQFLEGMPETKPPKIKE